MKQKSNFRLGINFIGTHLLATVLALIVTFSLVAVSESTIYLIAVGAFVLLMYWGIIGGPAYKLGNDDSNRVNFKRMEKDIFRGFKVGIVTFIYPAVQILIVILFKLGVIPDLFFVYKLLNSHLLIPMNLVQNVGFVADASWGTIIIMLSFQLITPIFIGIHYILGFNNVSFLDKLIYKKTDTRKS